MNSISAINEIIDEIRQGHMVILVDEEDRENEGDLVLAAQFATPEHILFHAVDCQADAIHCDGSLHRNIAADIVWGAYDKGHAIVDGFEANDAPDTIHMAAKQMPAKAVGKAQGFF